MAANATAGDGGGTTEDDFAIIESAEEVLLSSTEATDSQAIEHQISNNYYIEEYLSLFHSKPGIGQMRRTALQSGLRSCRFRSMCWRVFLECLPESSDERVVKIQEYRQNYEIIQEKYNRDPRDAGNTGATAAMATTGSAGADDSSPTIDGTDNPLSQETTSQWNLFFSDNELRSRITQDVIRTFPEIDFFQLKSIQTVMVNILFHFARENPPIDYKQGMHELLAPLLFVIHCDHQTFLHAEEIGLIEEEIKVLMDPAYIESDTYYLFCSVMDRVESWYDNHSIQTKPDAINVEPFSAPTETSLFSTLGIKLKMINEQIVKRHDHELYNHLAQMEITPQIYGIRWMRLLFGREFQMQDLLVIWDAIFADGFALCDYIFAAMLLVIKKLLLVSDYAQCLYHLMRYPSVPDIHYIIHLALHLRDPLNYSEPIGYSSLVMPNISVDSSPNSPSRTGPANSRHNTWSSISRNNASAKSNGQSVSSAVRPNTLSVQMADRKQSAAAAGDSPKRKPIAANSSTNNDKHRPTPPSVVANNELTHISSIDFPATSSAQSDEETDQLREELRELRHKMDYCCQHMTGHLDVMQRALAAGGGLGAYEDEAMVALAELKRCRDVLKGTLRFTQK